MNTISNGGYLNTLSTLNLWRDRLASLTVSAVVWENLPPSIDVRYLEYELFYHGKIIFFIADDQLVCLSGFGTSLPNLYNVPTQRTVNANNGFTANLTDLNSVICYNDILRKPGAVSANIYANRLAELDSAIDVNIKAQKTPVLLRASKLSELSVKNAYLQLDGNSPAIAITEDWDDNAIKALNTEAPFHAPDMRSLQHDLLCEYMQSIGIANGGNYKAERLVSSEVATNNAGVAVQRRSRLLPRQQAAEMINMMFSDYISAPVRVRYEYDALDDILGSGGLDYE